MSEEPSSIGFNISWIARMMRTRFDARARAVGLTRAQWRMIATIRMREGATQSEVASQLEINSVTAGRIIDRLDAAGMVERRASATDRRSNHLYLTDAASPILNTLGVIGAEEARLSLRGFSDEDRRTLVDLLDRLAANMAAATASCEAVEEGELEAGAVIEADG